MKKNDAGYALPLVLVVMTILSLLAVTVMTFSLESFQSQQRSVASMQAKYEAQGKLEIITALIQRGKSNTPISIEEEKTTIVKSGNELTITVSDEAETVWIVTELELYGLSESDITVDGEPGDYQLTFTSVPELRYKSYAVQNENPLPENTEGVPGVDANPPDENGGGA